MTTDCLDIYNSHTSQWPILLKHFNIYVENVIADSKKKERSVYRNNYFKKPECSYP